MPIRREVVKRHVDFWLRCLHSFLKTGTDWEHRRNPLDEFIDFISSEAAIGLGEGVLGVYVNDPENMHFLVITDQGIHQVNGERKQFLSYDSIESIREPLSEEYDLDILLESGECTSLPILSSTDDESDARAFYDFFSELLPWRRQDLAQIQKIKSHADLIGYLSDSESPHMGEWMQNKFMQYCDNELKIDPAIFQNSDIWRLCAFLLVAKPWEDSE